MALQTAVLQLRSLCINHIGEVGSAFSPLPVVNKKEGGAWSFHMFGLAIFTQVMGRLFVFWSVKDQQVNSITAISVLLKRMKEKG